jgi:hypothetical protein
MVADENRQKQGKEVEKKDIFTIIFKNIWQRKNQKLSDIAPVSPTCVYILLFFVWFQLFRYQNWQFWLLLIIFLNSVIAISNFSIYFVHILKVRPFNYQKSDKQNSANGRHPIISLKLTSDFSILVFVSVQLYLLIFLIRLTILLKLQSRSLFTDYSEELFMQNKTYADDFIWHISLLHSFVLYATSVNYSNTKNCKELNVYQSN